MSDFLFSSSSLLLLHQLLLLLLLLPQLRLLLLPPLRLLLLLLLLCGQHRLLLHQTPKKKKTTSLRECFKIGLRLEAESFSNTKHANKNTNERGEICTEKPMFFFLSFFFFLFLLSLVLFSPVSNETLLVVSYRRILPACYLRRLVAFASSTVRSCDKEPHQKAFYSEAV